MASIDTSGVQDDLNTASSKLSMQNGSVAQSEFKTGSLPPSWVIEGSPVVRALSLTKSDDGLFSCGLWDSTAGKFKYIFSCDEIVHILEGEVTVEDDHRQQTLRPGDVAFFPQGSTTYWTVPNYVKKFCIHRSVQQSLSSKILTRLKGLLKHSPTGCVAYYTAEANFPALSFFCESLTAAL